MRVGSESVNDVHARLGQRSRLVLSGDSILELAHPAAERSPHLGQPLRAEDEQERDQEQHQLLDSETPGSVTALGLRDPGRVGSRTVSPSSGRFA